MVGNYCDRILPLTKDLNLLLKGNQVISRWASVIYSGICFDSVQDCGELGVKV